MKAIGANQAHPISHLESLFDFEAPQPTPGPRDVLIKVQAVSVNPVDTKTRTRIEGIVDQPQIMGYDAVGEVVAVGNDVSYYTPGDMVFYAGAIDRPGSNAEYQLVDERIVGRKPESLSNAEAAALPLTTITAWEMLFDHFGVTRENSQDKTLLVLAGAGGVGSIMIQLARHLTDLTIIATASRDETRAWVEDMGAHHVIDHSKPLADELARIGHDTVNYIAAISHTDTYKSIYADIVAPFGRIVILDGPDGFDIMPFRMKSAAIHWQMMFTRSYFQTPDMDVQRQLLNTVSEMVDAGTIKSTLTETSGPICAESLKAAHEKVESGRMIGKLVVDGW